jgi:hypothetical protein
MLTIVSVVSGLIHPHRKRFVFKAVAALPSPA